MDSIQVFKIFLYTFLDLIPCLVLALTPFKERFRFSFLKTHLLLPLLFLMVFISRVLTMQGLSIAHFFTVLWVALYLALYVACVKIPVYILLFVLLTILNYGSFKAILVNWIAIGLSVKPLERYSFLSCISLFCVYLLSFPFMYHIMKHKVKSLIDKTGNNRYWRFLWLVPATFCLSYYYNLYANGGIIAFSTQNSNVLFAILFNLGALFVTFLILELLEEFNGKLLLEQENYHLTMQSVQYRIEEARQAKHDLRQHLSVIQSCLQKQDYERLSIYVRNYLQTLPSSSPITYCEDYALNALIVYYENIAADHHIRFTASIDYPPMYSILSSDAVILFGNLLENALEACIRETSKEPEPFVSLCIKHIQSMLVATVDNTCTTSLRYNENGFPSSKASRMGIGTVSIRKIAEKYQGTAQFKQDNGVFYSSVLLYPYTLNQET